MDVDKELLTQPTMTKISEPTRGQNYPEHIRDSPKSKGKGKEKGQEPSSDGESDKQLAIYYNGCTMQESPRMLKLMLFRT